MQEIEGNQNQINSIEKLIDILLLFRSHAVGIRVEEISQTLDIPRSTVYRYVKTLSDRGFLEKMGDGNYRLGLVLVELGRTALNSNRDLRLLVFDSMKRLARAVNESVTLMTLYDRHAVCMENIEGTYPLRVMMERGRSQPLHAGASSKVLLASRPESQWQHLIDFPLVSYTDQTITDFGQLVIELKRIRAQGFGTSSGEIDIGAFAVAVPLENQHGEVVAALSIEAPESRVNEAIRDHYVTLLKQEAALIREQLV